MKQDKEQGRLYKMYGNFVPVPHKWYKLCRKYEIPKEVVVLKNKGNTVDLNPMEINVLAYLANYDDCYPSNKQIASIFHVGISTIEKYLKELRWVGFIKTFEEKKEPTHTDKRNIYVQFDVIDSVLKSESNPYKCMVPYKRMGSSENNPYECMGQTIQTDGLSHTGVGDNPYMLATNNKTLKSIRKNNKEVANAPAANGKPSALTSNEVIPFKTCESKQMDLNIFSNITEHDVKNLKFNSQSHADMFDDYEFVEMIYDHYVQCCSYKRNADNTISSIKAIMKQYNCNEDVIEKCIGYFIYQHRLLKRDINDIKIHFDHDNVAS